MTDRFGLNLRLDGKVTMRARMLQMAMRQGGLTSFDAQQAFNITAGNVSNQFFVLQDRGLLQRLPREKGERLRFVITDAGRAALAEVGLAQPYLADAESPVRRIGATPTQQAALARAIGRPGHKLVVPPKPSTDAPVVIKGDNTPRGKPVFPSGGKTTVGIAAGYDPRYQCGPDERPYGAGFAAAGIWRDINTGRGWGQS